MGGETPETCCATHKRQVINLWNCILLVEIFRFVVLPTPFIQRFQDCGVSDVLTPEFWVGADVWRKHGVLISDDVQFHYFPGGYTTDIWTHDSVNRKQEFQSIGPQSFMSICKCLRVDVFLRFLNPSPTFNPHLTPLNLYSWKNVV
jgi:hypothetical protein